MHEKSGVWISADGSANHVYLIRLREATRPGETVARVRNAQAARPDVGTAHT